MEINAHNVVIYFLKYITLCFISSCVIIIINQNIKKNLLQSSIRHEIKITNYIRYNSLTFGLFHNKFKNVLFLLSVFLITPTIIILFMFILDKMRISYIYYKYYYVN